ncbi:MAG TPA: transposase [Candidatus Acidoferrales bacterium]|nr:transposase [Candidatus Acidoferrales bacterium]
MGSRFLRADINLDQALARILEDGRLKLSGSFRVLLAQLRLELEQITSRIEEMDPVIQKIVKENEDGQRLTEIPGVGPITATALIAAVGNASAFRKRAKSGGLDGDCSGRIFHRGQTEIAGDQ